LAPNASALADALRSGLATRTIMTIAFRGTGSVGMPAASGCHLALDPLKP
jgi:hypothetical protein